MRKIAVITTLMLLLVEGVACAASLELSRKADAYKVTLRMASRPLSVSDNKVIIVVSGTTGPLTGADLRLRYFMPSMPSMNYETGAVFRNDAYEAVIRPTMPGVWTIEVRVKDSDGNTHNAVFDFQVK
jgi:hypothetical protein